MIERVKDFWFTGKRYVGMVVINRRELVVSYEPERGQSVDEVKALMIAKAKEQILDEVTR